MEQAECEEAWRAPARRVRKLALAVTPIPALFKALSAAEVEAVLTDEGIDYVVQSVARATLTTETFPSTVRYRRALLRRLMNEADMAGVALTEALVEAYSEVVSVPTGDDDFFRIYLIDADGASDDTDALCVGIDFVAVAVSSAFNDVGMTLWPAAFVLAEYVASLPPLIAGAASVLELGAGVGFSGIVARLTLPPSIPLTLTDRPGEVLDRLASNVANNGLPSPVSGPCEYAPLDWYDFDAALFAGAADVVIAADCVYDPSLIAGFVNVVACLIASGHTRAAVVVSRLRREETYAKFVETAEAAGLAVAKLDLADVPHRFDVDPDDRLGIVGAVITGAPQAE